MLSSPPHNLLSSPPRDGEDAQVSPPGFMPEYFFTVNLFEIWVAKSIPGTYFETKGSLHDLKLRRGGEEDTR